MKNNTLGWGILVAIALAFANELLGGGDDGYMLAGLLYIFFGIWGGIRLVKSND